MWVNALAVWKGYRVSPALMALKAEGRAQEVELQRVGGSHKLAVCSWL